MEHAMSVLIYLVPMALGLGLLGLAAFLWSLRSGQYDDLDGAALRILGDDDVERSRETILPAPRNRPETDQAHIGSHEHG
jgi:cbb3-type cytochrome oxidase maturation protein